MKKKCFESKHLKKFDQLKGVSVEKLKEKMEKEEVLLRKESKSLDYLKSQQKIGGRKTTSEKLIPDKVERQSCFQKNSFKLPLIEKIFQLGRKDNEAHMEKERPRLFSCENLRKYLNPEFLSKKKSNSLKKSQKDHHPMIKARIRTMKTQCVLPYNNRKTLKLNEPERPRKLEPGEKLKDLVPEEGYKYIDLNFKTNDICTISKNGILLSMKDQDELLSTNQMERILKITNKIKKISFFKYFYREKLFFIWKKVIKIQRYEDVRLSLKIKIKYLYPLQFIIMKDLLNKLLNTSIIKVIENKPLKINEFKDYLHVTSLLSLQSIKSNYFQKICDVVLKPFHKQYEVNSVKYENKDGMIENDKSKRQGFRITHTQNRLHLNRKYRNTYSFKHLQFMFQIHLRKVFYILTDYSIILVEKKVEQIKQLLQHNLDLYIEKRPSYLDYLKKIEITMKKGLDPFQVFYVNDLRIQQVSLVLMFSNDNQISVREKEITETKQIILALVDHIIIRFTEENLFTSQNQLESQILKNIFQTINIYKSSYLLEDIGIRKGFRQWFEQNLKDNHDFVKEMIQQIYSITSDISDFIEEEKKIINQDNEQYLNNVEINRQKFFVHSTKLKNFRSLIKRFPDNISVGLFCLDLSILKEIIQEKIDKLQQVMEKFIPNHFDQISNELLSHISHFLQSIKLSTWTVEDFVASCLKREQFNEFMTEKRLEEKFDVLKDYLSFISNINQKLYFQKHLEYIKVKEEIKKLNSQSQMFDLGKTSKLKHFEKKVDFIRQKIWHDLIALNRNLSNLVNDDSEIADMDNLLNKLKNHQNSLGKLKEKIFIVNYMENCQIENCLNKDAISDFSSYDKLTKNIKLLIEYIQRYLKINLKIQTALDQYIKQVRYDLILNELGQIINETKVVQNSLMQYNYLISKIKNQYLSYQKFFYIINQMCEFDERELKQILKKNSNNLDFSKKKTFCVRDALYLRSNENYDELRKILIQYESRKKLLNLKTEVEQFLRGTILEKMFLKNQKQYHQNQAEKQNIEIISYFCNIEDIIIILKDFQFDLELLDQTTNAELNELKSEILESMEIVSSLIQLLELLNIAQNKYLNPKNTINDSQTSELFNEYKNELKAKNEDWLAIVGFLQDKPLSNFVDELKRGMFLIEGFIKSINFLYSILEMKIEDKKKQINLLNFCSDRAVMKIIQNPMNFFQQFFPFVQEAKIENSVMKIITYYREIITLETLQKPKQLNIDKLLLKISKFIQEQLLAEQCSQQRLLQVQYVEMNIKFRQRVDNSEPQQIIFICNNQIQRLVDTIHSLKEYDFYLQLKYDILISFVLQFRGMIDCDDSRYWLEEALHYVEIEDEESYKIQYVNFLDRVLLNNELIDSKNLAFHYPNSQRMIFNLVSSISRKDWILAENLEILQTINSRLFRMSKVIKLHNDSLNFFQKIIKKIRFLSISLIFDNYSSKFYQICENLAAQFLKIKQIKDKIKTRKKVAQTIPEKGISSFPSVFLVQNEKGTQIWSEKAKLTFRMIAYLPPSWKHLFQFSYFIKYRGIINQKYHKKAIQFIQVYEKLLIQQNYPIKISHLKNLYVKFLDLLKRKEKRQKTKNGENIDNLIGNLLKNLGIGNEELIQIFTKQVHDTIASEATEENTNTENVFGKSFIDSVMKMMNVENKLSQKDSQKQSKQSKNDQLKEMIDQNKPIALIGPPFCGKSYLIEELLNLQVSKQIKKMHIPIQIFNTLTKYLKQQAKFQKLISAHENLQIDGLWIVFQGFFTSENFSISEVVFRQFCQSYQQSTKALNQVMYFFQLRTLAQISPNLILQLSIFISDVQKPEVNSIFQVKMKKIETLFNLKGDQVYILPEASDILQVFFKIYDSRELKWQIKPEKSLLMKNTFQLFFSISNKHMKKMKEILYSFKRKNSKQCIKNLILYSLYWTVYFCLSDTSRTELDFYFSFSHPENASVNKIFFNKKVEFIGGQLFFNQEIYNLNVIDNLEAQKFSGEVQTFEMKIYSYFCSMLVKNCVSIALIGDSETGKSSFARYFKYMDPVDNITHNYYRGIESLNGIGKQIMDISIFTIKTLNFFENDSFSTKKLIYIEDLALPSESERLHNYLKYIIESQSYIYQEKVRRIRNLFFLLQINKQQWNEDNLRTFYPFFFISNKYYFEKIFENLLQRYNIIEGELTNERIQGSPDENYSILGRKYVKLIKNLNTIVKPKLKNWNMTLSFSFLENCLFQQSNFRSFFKLDLFLKQTESFERVLKFKLQAMLSEKQKEKLPEDLFKEVITPSQISIPYPIEISENLFQKKGLRKLIFFPGLRQNLENFLTATKIWDCILVNRLNVYKYDTFLSIVTEVFDQSFHKIQTLNSLNDFEFQLSRLAKRSTFHKQQCILINLETLMNHPEILNYIEALLGKDKFLTFSSKKSDFEISKSISHPLILIIETPNYNSELIMKFFQNKKIMKRAVSVHLSEPKGEDFEMLAVKMVTQKYAKKNKDEVYQLIKNLTRIFENIQGFKIPFVLNKTLFSYEKYLEYIEDFFMIYQKNMTELQSHKNSYETTLSSLTFFFRQYSNMIKDFSLTTKHLKQTQYDVKATQKMIEQKKNYLDTYKFSEQYRKRNEFLENIQQSTEKIRGIKKKFDELRQQTEASYDAINRMEIAQLKYLFTNSFGNYKQFFQAFSLSLGESTEYEAMKKLFADINLISKIRENKFEDRNIQVVLSIQSRLENLKQKERSFAKNLFDWIQYRIKYQKLNLTIRETLVFLEKNIEQKKEQIKNIDEKLQIQQTELQLKTLEQREKELTFSYNQISKDYNSLSHSIHISEKIQYFQMLENISKQMLQSVCEKLSVLQFHSYAVTAEAAFLSSMPNKLRKQCKRKNEKFIEKVIFNNQSRFNEIEDFLFNSIEDILTFSYDTCSPQKIRTIRYINFLTKNGRQVMVIDNYESLINDITNEHFILVELIQISDPKFNKRIADIPLIFIKLPPSEWTIQILQATDLLGNNKILKWKKYQIILNKNQTVIFLKRETNIYIDLAKKYKIIYYDYEQNQNYCEQIKVIMTSTYMKNRIRDHGNQYIFDYKKTFDRKKESILQEINDEISRETNQKFNIRNCEYLLHLSKMLMDLKHCNDKIKQLDFLSTLEYWEEQQIKSSATFIAYTYSVYKKIQPQDIFCQHLQILKTGVTTAILSMTSKNQNFVIVTNFFLSFLMMTVNDQDMFYTYLSQSERCGANHDLTTLQIQSLNAEPSNFQLMDLLIDSMENFQRFKGQKINFRAKIMKSIKIENNVKRMVQNIDKFSDPNDLEKQILETSENTFEKLALYKLFSPEKYFEFFLDSSFDFKRIHNKSRIQDLRYILFHKSIYCQCDSDYWQFYLRHLHVNNTKSRKIKLFSLSQIAMVERYQIKFTADDLLVFIDDTVKDIVLYKEGIQSVGKVKQFILLSSKALTSYTKTFNVIHINHFLRIFLQAEYSLSAAILSVPERNFYQKVLEILKISCFDLGIRKRFIVENYLMQIFFQLTKTFDDYKKVIDIFESVYLSKLNLKIQKIYNYCTNLRDCSFLEKILTDKTIREFRFSNKVSEFQLIEQIQEKNQMYETTFRKLKKKLESIEKNLFFPSMGFEEPKNIIILQKYSILSRVHSKMQKMQNINQFVIGKKKLGIQSLDFFLKNHKQFSFFELYNELYDLLLWEWNEDQLHIDKIRSKSSLILLYRILPRIFQLKKEEGRFFDDFRFDDEQKKSDDDSSFPDNHREKRTKRKKTAKVKKEYYFSLGGKQFKIMKNSLKKSVKKGKVSIFVIKTKNLKTPFKVKIDEYSKKVLSLKLH